MQSDIKMPNINTQLQGISGRKSSKLSLKKIALYRSSDLFH